MLKSNIKKEQISSQIVMIKVILSPPRLVPSDFLIFKSKVLKKQEVMIMNQQMPRLKC